jgi:spore coat polysaccharide biosynthesis protein SpsF
MKIGYIILCRYDSSRLPGKILLKIKEKPILQYIHERLSCVANYENIIVATGNDKTNRPIVDYCRRNELLCFQGDVNNVAKRFLDCAENYNFDYAARINGDNLFTSPIIIRNMLPYVQKNIYDFVSNVKDRTFPTGMSVEFLRPEYYRNIINKFTSPEHFEHVTLYLYQNENEGCRYYFYNSICPEAKGINFAIDTDEDFKFAERQLLKINNDHVCYDLCDWVKMLG